LIELDDGERLSRALARERAQQHPRYEEMCRRYLADAEDFSEENLEAAGIKMGYQNDKLEECVQELKNSIIIDKNSACTSIL